MKEEDMKICWEDKKVERREDTVREEEKNGWEAGAK